MPKPPCVPERAAPRPHPRLRPLLLLAAGALAACLAACTTSGDYLGSPDELSARELAERPRIGQVMADYDVILTELRDELSRAFPAGAWRADGEPTVSSVRLSDGQISVRRGRSSLWVFDQSISTDDESKERARHVANKVATRHGFSEFIAYVDRDGEIQLVADDRYGGTIKLGSVKFTVLSCTTSYHLPDEDEPTGDPPPVSP